jgi:hypothetical protein
MIQKTYQPTFFPFLVELKQLTAICCIYNQY